MLPTSFKREFFFVFQHLQNEIYKPFNILYIKYKK